MRDYVQDYERLCATMGDYGRLWETMHHSDSPANVNDCEWVQKKKTKHSAVFRPGTGGDFPALSLDRRRIAWKSAEIQ